MSKSLWYQILASFQSDILFECYQCLGQHMAQHYTLFLKALNMMLHAHGLICVSRVKEYIAWSQTLDVLHRWSSLQVRHGFTPSSAPFSNLACRLPSYYYPNALRCICILNATNASRFPVVHSSSFKHNVVYPEGRSFSLLFIHHLQSCLNHYAGG